MKQFYRKLCNIVEQEEETVLELYFVTENFPKLSNPFHRQIDSAIINAIIRVFHVNLLDKYSRGRVLKKRVVC